MEFSDLQEKVIKRANNYSKENGIEIDTHFAVLKLYEEIGEFTQALLMHDGRSRPSKKIEKSESHKKMAQELADVVCLAILNAHHLDVDLEEEIKKKWFFDKA